MKYLAIAAAAIFVLATCVTGLEARSRARAFTDAGEFVQELKSSGHFEYVASTLALQRSDNEAVKKFAQKILDDQKAADQKLDDTLKQAKLPEPEYAMNEEDGELAQQLDPEHGARFDRLYIQGVTEASREAIELLENYGMHGDNADLKKLAETLLPEVKEHYQMAQNLGASNATARR